jgi:hypothetical protein
MLYVILECSDRSCDAVYEAWGELDDLDGLTCEGCGCALVAVAFSEAGQDGARRSRLEIQLRDAA